MHESFIDIMNNLQNECLLKTEAYLVLCKYSWFEAFEKHFRTICYDIVKAQNESLISPLSHLEYTMKYVNFLTRRYIAEIWVYGDKWYMDKSQRMIGEYDISFLFTHFEELWDKLIAQRKRYVGKVSSQEVTSFMIESLPKFYSYLTNVVRFAITECVEEKPFIDIIKNDVFKVRVGDYMAKTEPVFSIKKNKDADALANYFSLRHRYKYIFEDCADLDFSSRDFSNTVLRYAQFRRAILNNANLKYCSLVGTSFYKAQLENCRLDHSAIYEADFSYANMKNAGLVAVRGKAGLPNENEWQHVGFLPVNFKNADLTSANLKWANLTGADFSGANLTNANFTYAVLDDVVFAGAILDGAVFTGTILEGASLAGITKKSADFAIPLDRVISTNTIIPRAEFMHYYVMEMAGNLSLPTAPKGEKTEIVMVSDSSRFCEIDYDARSELISDRLKLLMEKYMLKYSFIPVVYYDKVKGEQIIYWRFKPPLYEDYQSSYRSDGIISHISYPISNAPLVFTARMHRGVRSIVVAMAVAESVLRRCILGVKFTKILDCS